MGINIYQKSKFDVRRLVRVVYGVGFETQCTLYAQVQILQPSFFLLFPEVLMFIVGYLNFPVWLMSSIDLFLAVKYECNKAERGYAKAWSFSSKVTSPRSINKKKATLKKKYKQRFSRKTEIVVEPIIYRWNNVLISKLMNTLCSKIWMFIPLIRIS